MNNHKVSMKDTKANVKTTIAENLTLYEAYSMVVDNRSKKDGNFYWIGGVYN